MKRFLVPGLIFLFFFGFLVRLYRFDNPVADWHAFRQSDTNAVSQIFVRDGINLLYPRYFDISNIQSGKDNPSGYRFVEFPIYNAAQVGVFGILGVFGASLAESGRLVSIFSTLAGALFTYLLVRKYANEVVGILSSGFYLFLPFSIFYGRTILPDPSMTASILAGIYFFDLWIEKDLRFKIYDLRFFLAVFFTGLAFLLKPYALFFTFPMVWMAYNRFGFDLFKKWQLFLFAIISIIPLVLWRIWIGQHPEGIPASTWLLNGNGIRFHPAFFKWIFYERITKLIMGYAGILFLVISIRFLVKNKNRWFFLSFLVSSLLYVSVIATGNVQHDYYQILIIPTISIFAGLGLYSIFELISKSTNKTMATGICSIILILSLFYSWKQVRDYFNINNPGMITAGEAANKILPKDAVVIAPFDNSTTFLNVIGRRGWPTFEKGIDDLVAMGATHLVISSPTRSDFEGFGKKYVHVAESKDYLILKLK